LGRLTLAVQRRETFVGVLGETSFMRHVIRDGFSSLVAAWAVAVLVLAAGQHAATVAFFIALPIMLLVARLARDEQERRSAARAR